MGPPQAETATRRLSFTSSTRTMVLLLVGALVAAVVVFVVMLSTGSFTASETSKASTFTAGTASLTVTTTDPLMDASGMKTGSVRSGEVTVTNTGSRAIVSVEAQGTGAEPLLASTLRLKITPANDPGDVRYNGSLAAAASPVSLGTYDTDVSTSWAFTLSLPSRVCPSPDPCVDPSLARKELPIDFEWMVRTP